MGSLTGQISSHPLRVRECVCVSVCDKLGKRFPYNGWRPGGVMETQREEELCLRGEEESGVEWRCVSQ